MQEHKINFKKLISKFHTLLTNFLCFSTSGFKISISYIPDGGMSERNVRDDKVSLSHLLNSLICKTVFFS